MHPRNKYKHGIDYIALAEHVAPQIDINRFLQREDVSLNSKVSYKLSLPDAPVTLLKALLLKDFESSIVVPDDRLCPAVPPRLDYVLWIQDIITFSNEASGRGIESAASCNIIDVGTGASIIYPLLGCKVLSPNVHFVGTEVDQASVDCALQNIQLNQLQSCVKVVKVDVDGPLLPPAIWQLHDRYAALMCNPPFYSTADEMDAAERSKNRPRIQALLGAPVETLTPGGAAGFILRILDESLAERHRTGWWSSLCGHQEVLETVVAELRAKMARRTTEGSEITNYAIAKFEHGSTTRWAVAWSFEDIYLPDDIARADNAQELLHLLPPARVEIRKGKGKI